jgi:2-polyprenyl-3-methyl-5-hydroxy-6-metoxy-1,4-benzoquinol methylase
MEAKKEACPACGSAAFAVKGDKGGFQVRKCKSCGTLYTAALPGAAPAYDYDEYYTPENLTVPDFVNQRLDQIVANFAPYRSKNRLLDIGCGAGTMLQAATRAQWAAEGLDVSPPAVEHLRERGFNVRCGYLEEMSYPAEHFDVVVACDVLEHVPEVTKLTDEIARILRPGGLFYATTPNGGGGSAFLLGVKWSVVSPPEHVHLFTPGGMKQFLRARGLRPRRVFSEGINVYEVLHVVRARNNKAVAPGGADFNRVHTSYALNEAFSRSPIRRLAKNIVNGMLRATQLGDQLKVYAEK